ncbi:ABC transporter substrate-binding protein [Pseudomonas rubra]|uniref:ABC transporter substrate-binding protein n=1 Tax=Pseudomonas rubra TaxID=2942627 RepID=A0ABT5P540_9PSED|nr:ABC transporter substrate-binding protein [Pseudomonas rubra]MDD1013409.1 ABC transporter substrate-binding protein [Pseudomonas rubra]MDD1040472.1 ABC transporter substrate-binding protein [Pseudomonas rubra]MDD1155077.1 ABC transporter substrate-binding protein [Pseudomonas rubra]
MTSLRKLLSVLLLPLCASAVQAKEWTEIRFGVYPEYPPFESVAADGSLQGFDIELGNAICAKLQVKCTWVHNEFDGMIPALRARKFDAIMSSMAVTPAREKQIDFSAKLFLSPTSVIVRKSADFGDTPESLKGKQIGVLQGSLQEAYARAKLAPLGAQVKAYQAQDQNYADLLNGRLDATLTDKLEAQLNFLSKPEGADFKSGPAIKDPTLPLDIAMGLRKNDSELKALLDKGIAAVHADGTFAAIQKKYVGELDIYNE